MRKIKNSNILQKILTYLFLNNPKENLAVISRERNPYFLRLFSSFEAFGYEGEELEGKRFLEFIHPEDRKLFESNFEEYVSGTFSENKFSNPMRLRFLSKGNDWKWGEAHLFVFREEIIFSLKEISEIIILEDNLNSLEESYRFLLDSIPQKIFFKDRNSVYLKCNRSYASDLRIKPEEIIGKTDYDFFTAELAEKYRADDRRVMESGKIEEIEESYIKDGNELFVRTIKVPVKDNKGNIIGILGIFWDVTEYKSKEEELKKSEERYRLISENTSDIITVTTFSPYPIYTYVSPSIKGIMGYEPEELLGKPALAAVHPDDKRYLLSLLKTYLEKKEVGGYETFERLKYRVMDKSGKWRYLESTVNIVKNELLIISRDITAREEIEKTLNKLSMAVEHSPAVVVITDTDANIEYVNPRFEELTEYSKKEVLGKNPRILQSGYTPPETYVNLWNTILNGEVWIGEFINRKKNGEIYYESARIAPVKDSKGNIVNFVAIKIDRTEEVKAEEKLKKSEQRYKIISQLTSDIATSFIYRKDGTLSIDWIVGQFENITGYNLEELREKGFIEGIIYEEDLEIYKNSLKIILEGKPHSCDYRIRRKDGKEVWVKAYGYKTEEKEETRICMAFQNITQLKLAEEALIEQAIKDPLTGLFNRRFMFDFVKREMNRALRQNRSIGFMMIDVNDFKKFNDFYGHSFGDRILIATAEKLQKSVRVSDIVVRYGGDEFLIILTDFEGYIKKIKERIKRSFENFVFPEIGFSISISVGCAVWSPSNPREIDAIISEADFEMYQDKRKCKMK
ncbi:MAG: PAS domain S-box protein [Candidatus Aminicenantia bacterium]